jgi:hypothetical protein
MTTADDSSVFHRRFKGKEEKKAAYEEGHIPLRGLL